MPITLTAGQLIQQAMKDAGSLGVGQTALAEDIQDSLLRLNMMIGQWRQKRWLVYHLQTHSLAMTGQSTFTIGPSGDINLPDAPRNLEYAFVRQTTTSGNQVDYPLQILQAREDYDRITLKTLRSLPNYVFYDSGYPLGTVYPWPIPTANIYSIFLTVKSLLDNFASTATSISLPEEYYAALLFNLAVRLRSMMRLPPDGGLVALASDSLNVIRKANTQIGRLALPLQLHRGGTYNPYSDRYN